MNPTTNTSFDYENANLGQKQSVQVTGLSGGDSVYIHILNFYNSGFSYTITTTEKTSRTSNLCTGGNPSTTTIYCDSCLTDREGAFCNYVPTQLQSGQIMSLVLNGGNYMPIVIPASSSKTAVNFYSSREDVVVFIQF